MFFHTPHKRRAPGFDAVSGDFSKHSGRQKPFHKSHSNGAFHQCVAECGFEDTVWLNSSDHKCDRGNSSLQCESFYVHSDHWWFRKLSHKSRKNVLWFCRGPVWCDFSISHWTWRIFHIENRNSKNLWPLPFSLLFLKCCHLPPSLEESAKMTFCERRLAPTESVCLNFWRFWKMSIRAPVWSE